MGISTMAKPKKENTIKSKSFRLIDTIKPPANCYAGGLNIEFKKKGTIYTTENEKIISDLRNSISVKEVTK